ncbi:hypothetical protein JCM8547_008963 [Rhodosporidiobolus lusitaniae]
MCCLVYRVVAERAFAALWLEIHLVTSPSVENFFIYNETGIVDEQGAKAFQYMPNLREVELDNFAVLDMSQYRDVFSTLHLNSLTFRPRSGSFPYLVTLSLAWAIFGSEDDKMSDLLTARNLPHLRALALYSVCVGTADVLPLLEGLSLDLDMLQLDYVDFAYIPRSLLRAPFPVITTWTRLSDSSNIPNDLMHIALTDPPHIRACTTTRSPCSGIDMEVLSQLSQRICTGRVPRSLHLPAVLTPQHDFLEPFFTLTVNLLVVVCGAFGVQIVRYDNDEEEITKCCPRFGGSQKDLKAKQLADGKASSGAVEEEARRGRRRA